MGNIQFTPMTVGAGQGIPVSLHTARGTQDLHERVSSLEETVKQQQKEIDELKAKVQSLIDSLTGGK